MVRYLKGQSATLDLSKQIIKVTEGLTALGRTQPDDASNANFLLCIFIDYVVACDPDRVPYVSVWNNIAVFVDVIQYKRTLPVGHSLHSLLVMINNQIQTLKRNPTERVNDITGRTPFLADYVTS